MLQKQMRSQIKAESLLFPTMYKSHKVTLPTCSGFCGSGSHILSNNYVKHCHHEAIKKKESELAKWDLDIRLQIDSTGKQILRLNSCHNIVSLLKQWGNSLFTSDWFWFVTFICHYEFYKPKPVTCEMWVTPLFY